MEIKCQLDATGDFYCRSYCLLNIFRAPLCPSSRAREYHTSGCCLWYLVLWFSSCRYGVELTTWKPKRQIPQAATTCIIPLMMGIVVPEICWASHKICNKSHLLHLVGILFPRVNDDARSKPHQILVPFLQIFWIVEFTIPNSRHTSIFFFPFYIILWSI